MDETSDEIIETIYQRIKNTTVEINSVVPDSWNASPSEEDHFVFDAMNELISESELIVVPPVAFDDSDGVYKFRDIHFYRLFMPADDGAPDYKPFKIQLVGKLSKDEATEKKRNWSIERNLINEMLSKNPSEEKISDLQQQLGDGYESPYTLVPPPSGDENS